MSLIDVETNDPECASFVNKNFHVSGGISASLQDPQASERDDNPEESEEEDVDKQCHLTCGGLCCQSLGGSCITKLVSLLMKAMVDNSLKVGHLLLLTSPSASFLGFVGITMKKPKLQIFLEASLDMASDQIHFFTANPGPDGNHHISFLTSHQVFHDKLNIKTEECVKVEVWKYDILWEHDHPIFQMSECTKTFELDPHIKVPVVKRHIRLPFGMKIEKRKAAQTRRRKQSKRKKAPDSKKLKKSQKREQLKDHSSGSGKVCSNSDIDIGDSDGDTDKCDNELSSDSDMDGDCEEPLPVSPKVVAEEKAARRDKEKFDKTVREYIDATSVADEELSGSVAGATATVVSTSGPSMPSSSSRPSSTSASTGQKASAKANAQNIPGKSFFSKELGLCEVAKAASARSVCYFCKCRIEKGHIRFSWYHNTLKPSVWIHQMCLKQLSIQENMLPTVKQKLETLRVSTSLSQDLKEAVTSVLDAWPKA